MLLGWREVDTGFRQLWAARTAVQQAEEDVGEAGTDSDERREQGGLVTRGTRFGIYPILKMLVETLLTCHVITP